MSSGADYSCLCGIVMMLKQDFHAAKLGGFVMLQLLRVFFLVMLASTQS